MENNPVVMQACKSDMKSFECYDARKGSTTAEVIECLREHKEELQKPLVNNQGGIKIAP